MTDYERILAEEYGIYTIRPIACPGLRAVPIERESKRKISPYAKFDKFHHKKKKRK